MKTLVVALLLLTATTFCWAEPNTDRALGEFYAKNFQGAMGDFDAALQRDPSNTFALVMWLECGHRLNKLDDCVATMEGRSGKLPNDALLLGQLGLAYMYQSTEKFSAATSGQEAFDKALSIDPNCSLAHAALGIYYFTDGKNAKARNQLAKALEVNPRDLMADERLGEILMTEDDKPELALLRFKPLVQALPNYADGYFFLGMASEKSKKTKEAVAAYERSIELDPNALTRSVYSRIRLARLYQDTKKKDLAIQLLTDLIRLRPDFKDAKEELEDIKGDKKAPPAEEETPGPFDNPQQQ